MLSGTAGDFNGDGYQDLVVGVPGENVLYLGTDFFDAGTVNVIYGSSEGLNADEVAQGNGFLNEIWHQGRPGVEGSPNYHDRFGFAVAAGDFNNDNFSDLAVGVPFETINAYEDAGAVHILYGSRNGLTTHLINDDGTVINDQYIYQGAQVDGFHTRPDGINEEAIQGSPSIGDKFGFSLAVGDFDNDSYTDLAIGVPGDNVEFSNKDNAFAGSVNIVYGSEDGLSGVRNQRLDQASTGVFGDPEAGDNFGFALAVGDFDGGNFDDLAVGVPFEMFKKQKDAGVVHVFYGASSGLTGDSKLWHQNVVNASGTKIQTAEPGDSFGFSLAAGDFGRGDLDDLAVGVPFENRGDIKDSGGVQILYGAVGGLTAEDSLFLDQDVEIGGVAIGGEAEKFDRFGYSLAAGDFGNGPHDDLAVGTPFEDVQSNEIKDAGIIQVFYGSFSGPSKHEMWLQNTSDNMKLEGVSEDFDLFGMSLVAGDFDNGDHDDLAVGAPLEDVAGNDIADAGAVHVLYSGPLGLSAEGNTIWAQSSDGVSGIAEAGDYFGAALTTASNLLPYWSPDRLVRQNELPASPHANFDNTLFEINRLRPDSGHFVEQTAYHDDWTPGWSHAESFTVVDAGGAHNHYVFLLKRSTGDVHIHRLNADGSLGIKVADYNWSTDWTTAEFYTINSRTFLLLHKRETGQLHIHEMNPNGTVGQDHGRHSSIAGLADKTTVQPYRVGGQWYLFALDRWSGKVAIYELRNDGSLGDQADQRQWTVGWSNIDFYMADGATFMVLYKQAEVPEMSNQGGRFGIKEMRPDGTPDNGWVTEGNWGKGWTQVKTFESEGQKFLFLYKVGSGDVQVQRLNSDGVGEITVDTFIDIGWTHMTPVHYGGQTYMISLNEENVDPLDYRKIEAMENEIRLRLEGQVNGFQFAVAQSGKIVHLSAYGNNFDDTPMTPNTQRDIMSVSKMITAVSVLKLVERGNLDLLEPFYTYLNPLKFPHSAIDPTIKQVTVLDLLTMTGQLARRDEAPDLAAINELLSMPRRIHKCHDFYPTALPGSPSRCLREYQNTGYFLQRLMLENILLKPALQAEPNEHPEALEQAILQLWLEDINLGEIHCSAGSGYDDSKSCSSSGWKTSSVEMLRFMSAMRYGKILSADMNALLLNAGLQDASLTPGSTAFGWDTPWSHRDGGELNLAKGGSSGDSQSVIQRLPDNIDAVLLIYGSEFPNSKVRDAYQLLSLPPTAVDDEYAVRPDSGATAFDVLQNDELQNDVEDPGETLTITRVTAGSVGGMTNIVGNTIEYTPSADFVGIETFEYRINDGTPGGDATATVVVTLELPSPRDAIWNGDSAVGEPGDGMSWGDANNWTIDGINDIIPTDTPPGDHITLQTAETVDVIDLESPRTVNSLSFEAGHTLENHSLTITTGNIAVQAGVTASIASNIINPVGVTKTDEGTLYVTGVAPAVEVASGTFILGSTGSVNALEIGAAATAVLNGPVLGDLVNNGTLIPSGDFNGDSALRAADIDALFSMLSGTVPQVDPRYDLVSDFVIDEQDVHRLVEDIMGKRWGDADLDGDVDLVDYHSLATHFDPTGRSMDHGWAQGDFDGDGDIDSRDFKTTIMNYSPLGYASSPSLNSVVDKEAASAVAIISVENKGVSIINEQDHRQRPFGRRGTWEWSKTWSQRGDLLDELGEGLMD